MASLLTRTPFAFVVAAATLAAPSLAQADDDADSARAAFVEGTSLVKNAQWAEALGAFERADKLKPHPVTTFNIAQCERAMGRYTRARVKFARALADNEAAGGKQLPESLVSEAKGYLTEIDRLLARANVSITPEGAAISVDGRPLEAAPSAGSSDGAPHLVAGTLAPGPGEAAPRGRFTIMLDPGAHVFTLSRKGYADAVVNRTIRPGGSVDLTLSLDRLPATLHVASDREGALVMVDGVDVGPAPVDILRPAGSHKILVRRSGFVAYESQVVVQPGEDVKLSAKLPEDKPSVLKRWWFWTGAVVVVGGAAVATYFATRSTPEPTRAEVNGGSLGWKLKVP